MPRSLYDDERGGWSTESDAGSDFPYNDDNASASKSSEEIANDLREHLERVPASLPSVVAVDTSSDSSIRSILRQLVNAGVQPQQWASSHHLFRNISQFVSEQPIFLRWLTSKENGWLLLQVPRSLHNPLFFISFPTVFKPTWPHLQMTTVILGCDNGTMKNHAEYMLASLCYQLLISNTDLEDQLLDIADDLVLAFRGNNFGWRENMLWSLLKTLLATGPNVPRIIAMIMSPGLGSAASQACVKILARLSDFTKHTDRSIKILTNFESCNLGSFDIQYNAAIDLNDDGTKNGLLADLNSWWDEVVQARLFLRAPEVEKEIRAMMAQHLDQPLLLFSYFETLKTRTWVSMAQLKADSKTLHSPHRFFSSILETIPHCDRQFVADALGFLECSGRPMTTFELATALAAARVPLGSGRLVDNVPLDLEYDVTHSLAGLVYIEFDRIWPLRCFWARQAMDDTIDTNQLNLKLETPLVAGPSWFHDRNTAGMKLAHACLRYIAICGRDTCSLPNLKHGVFGGHLSFLDYAVTFWHSHYSIASREGTADDIVRSLIDQEPEVLQLWLTIEGSIRPWGVYVDAPSVGRITTFSATDIGTKFGIGYSEAISTLGLATCLMPAMDNDEYTATIWSAWLLHRPLGVSATTWLQKTQSSASPDALLKVFSYAPEPTFELLLVHSDFSWDNARAILDVAVQQGTVPIVEYYLDHLNLSLDEKLLSEMPLVSTVRGGAISTLQKLVRHWHASDEFLSHELGTALLYSAVRYGQLDILDSLLSLGSRNEDVADDHVLLYAAQTGYRDVFQRLISQRSTLATRQPQADSETALHCASANNYVNILKDLISRGAFLGAKNSQGEVALHLAARNGHVEVVRLLIRASLNLQPDAALDIERGTTATKQNHARLDKSGLATFSATSRNKRIPLEEAIMNGHEKVTSVLLRETPNDVLQGRLLLHIAVRSEQLGTLKTILDFEDIKVSIDETDESGRTALHQACMKGSVEMVQELIGRGANAWASDEDLDTPFMCICRLREDVMVRIVGMILKSRRNNQWLERLLLSAAELGREKLVTMLLDSGVDKNAQNNSGRNALHLAAFNEKESVVRVLLMRRMNLDMIDSWGDSAVRDAASRDCRNIVKLLLDAGALKTIENEPEGQRTEDDDRIKYQSSLLYFAATSGSLETLRLLFERGERFPSEDACPLEKLTRERATSPLELILDYHPELEGSALLAKCFHIALRNDDRKALSILLKKKADPNVISVKMRLGTALHECAFYGNVSMARALLDHSELFEVNQTAGRLHTPLIAAVAWPYPSRGSTRLLENKAERRLIRQKEMVKFLRDEHGDPDKSGSSFGTMLNAATSRGPPELVQFVLNEIGLEATLRDHEGRSAVHMACVASAYGDDNLKLLERLPGVSALLSSPDNHGRSPLHFASGNGTLSTLQYLLDNVDVRVDPNQCDLDGWTPLHWACRQWDVIVIQLLVSHGALSDSTTTTGWTPWDVAVLHGNGTGDFWHALSPLKTDKTAVVEIGECHSFMCDSCFITIYGIRHTCEQCLDYHLCFKCYGMSSSLHLIDHTFQKVGEINITSSRMDHSVTMIPDRHSYTVGWICALPFESAAAQAFLDERHEVPSEVADNDSYITGRIGKHNVVIAVTPLNEYGTTSAALTARNMVHSFPQIRFSLMVGVGGGAPSAEHDIRLGDIVVSGMGNGRGGVIQFDYGKVIQSHPQGFQITGSLNQPPLPLLTAAAALSATYELEGPQLNEKVNKALNKQRKAFKNKFTRPPDDTDRLYRAEVSHPEGSPSVCSDTCGVGPEYLVQRHPRDDDDDNPSIHHGPIASSSQVMKNSMARDKLAQTGILCFDVGVAGLMNHFPCLVVRGICDYADSHKNSRWQPYAAMTAAAYAKDLLGYVHPPAVEDERRVSDLLLSVTDIQKGQNELSNELEASLDVMRLRKSAESFQNWLRPSDPSYDANRSRELRYPGTGSWFLTSAAFQGWVSGDCQHLCVYGPAGCGKTVLSSTVLDYLKENQHRTVLYFFFDFADSRKVTVNGALSSLLYQLYLLGESFAQTLDDLRKYHDNGQMQPSTGNLISCLQAVLRRVEKPVILLDALDECDGKEHEREVLIKWIITLGSAPSLGHVQIITTTRPEAAFLTRLGPMLKHANSVYLDNEAIKSDIESYVKGCLRVGPGFHTHAPDHPIVKQIPDRLMQKADGIFRYAACQIDDIVSCLGPEEIEDVLESIPERIQETYKKAINQIPRRFYEKTIRLFQFLLNLNQPLDLEAAVDIMAVRSDFRGFNPGDRIRPEDITRLCPDMLSIKDVPNSSTVIQSRQRQLHLAHLSVKEYLVQYDTSTFVGRNASASIVRTCLSYLSRYSGHHSEEGTRPFAKFAEFMWIEHAAAAEWDPQAVSAMAGYLETDFHRKCPWQKVTIKPPIDPVNLQTSCLHFASGLGLQETAKDLILRGVDVNSRIEQESDNMTLLEVASFMDQVEIVRILLEAGVDPNTTGNKERNVKRVATGSEAHGSALRISCKKGNLSITKLLARKGADLHRLEGDKHMEQSPLQIAISKRDMGLIKLLLDEGVDVHANCGHFGNALQTASLLGSNDIVALLLQNGADVNARGGAYGHSLQAAAKEGNGDIIKLLLNNGADVNSQGGRLGNPLYAAVTEGHIDIVNVLLNSGADVNAPGGPYRTQPALAAACMGELLEVTTLLLNHGANVNARFLVHEIHFMIIIGTDQSALQMFIARDVRNWNDQSMGILKKLLEAGADIHPHESPSALQLAVKRGHLEPISLLLSEGADPNILWHPSIEPFNHSLLMESLFKSQPEIAVELLRFKADPNTKSNRYGPEKTALHLALDGDFEDVVRILLQKGADPSQMSGSPPFTPLQLAVKKGSVKYTRVFLQHGANVEALGGYRDRLTAMELAEKAGNEEIIRLLNQTATGRMSGNRQEGENEIGMPEKLQERGG